jgi:hypothetical protein
MHQLVFPYQIIPYGYYARAMVIFLMISGSDSGEVAALLTVALPSAITGCKHGYMTQKSMQE